MDIATSSMNLNNVKFIQQAYVSVLKRAIDSREIQTTELLSMLEAYTKMMEQMMSPLLVGIGDINA